MNTTRRLIVILVMICATQVDAKDWPGFRGATYQGRTSDKYLPLTWSDTENVRWKKALPGFGSSSPIVVRGRVYVTCYSGYGLDKDEPGDPGSLQRHVMCFKTSNGQLLWQKSFEAVQPELPYKGMLREHGYASSTPVSDGQRVYVFLGKNGVVAFDLNGEQLWQETVGTGSDTKKWGSATSPVLYKDLVIVNAWDEGKKLIALNKATGAPVWKIDLSETGLTYSTPVVAQLRNRTVELIMVLPTQVWGLSPQTGERLWTVSTTMKDSTLGTPVVVGDVVYAYGGGPGSLMGLAIRLGGRGDVTDTHVVWSGKEAVSGPSPVVVGEHLYWVDTSGKACCQRVKTGKLQYTRDLPAAGRFSVYASVIEAEGRVYAVTRQGGTFVLPAKPGFRILAHNSLASDGSDFNGSPAVSNSKIFMRSNRFLYCIGLKPKPR
jgi:outer membrane protein assembly factor BamB